MQVSDKGVQFIASEEGKVLKAYRDVAGVLTIGYGHTNLAGTAPKVTPGMRITEAEALDILKRDLAKFSARVDKRMGNQPQHVHDGSASFDFNTGAILKASWVAAFLSGNKTDARRRLKMWNKAGGRVVRGLVNRRNHEAMVIFDGVYPNMISPSAPSAPTDSGAVLEYQRQLQDLGYYDGKLDGIRGPKTDKAVEAFQKDQDLTVDSIVGPATRAALRTALGDKAADGAAKTSVVVGGAGAAGAKTVIDPGQMDPGNFAEYAAWIGGGAIALMMLALIVYFVWRYRGVILRRRSPV